MGIPTTVGDPGRKVAELWPIRHFVAKAVMVGISASNSFCAGVANRFPICLRDTHEHTGKTRELRRVDLKPVCRVLRQVPVNDLVGESIDDDVK